MNKKIIITLTFIVILVGIFLYIQNHTTLKNQKPNSVESIRFNIYELPTLALVYIAENEGYFKDENLDIKYKKFITGKDGLADALAGNADIAAAYETPVLRQIYEGKEVSVISTLHRSSKYMALVGMRSKGINKIEDIKGKKIGVYKGTSHEFFLTSYLTSQGIKLSEVTLVNVAYKDSLSSLSSGAVDAVVAENPYFYDIKKAIAPERLIIFESDIYTTNSVLAGSTSVIRNKKEALTRLLRALVRAENLTKNNKEQAIKDVIKALPNFSEESIRGTWDYFTPSLSLDNVLMSIMIKEAQWFKENNIYQDPIPDFRKALFTDYLVKVKPDSVTVY